MDLHLPNLICQELLQSLLDVACGLADLVHRRKRISLGGTHVIKGLFGVLLETVFHLLLFHLFPSTILVEHFHDVHESLTDAAFDIINIAVAL